MYAKVFNQIFDSSIADDWKTRVVFQDLLILADWTGQVDMTPNAIARRTAMPLKMVVAAISKLSEPDPTSRTPGEEGRRIVLLEEHRDWGWQIVNFLKYRTMRDEDDRRDQNRKAAKKHRENKQSSSLRLTRADDGDESAKSAHRDIDKEVHRDIDKEKREREAKKRPRNLDTALMYAKEIELSEQECRKWHAHFEGNGWRTGKNAVKDWKATMRKWELSAGDFKPSQGTGSGNQANATRPPSVYNLNKQLEAVEREISTIRNNAEHVGLDDCDRRNLKPLKEKQKQLKTQLLTA